MIRGSGTTRRPRWRRALIVVLAAPALVGACGATPPSPSSSGPSSAAASRSPGPPGLDWSQASAVERPEGMDATPPSVSPVGGGGGLGHPGHFAGQGNVFDVAAVGDRLVAVGYTFPDFRGVTWTSAGADRQTWTLAPLPGPPEPTFPTAIAWEPDGAAVAVGRVGSRAAAWRTEDGIAWTPLDGGDAFVEAPETRMTAIAWTDRGFVAAGWSGVITEPGHPRFWTSGDSRVWTRAGDPTTGEDGRVTALAAGPGGLVAVGTTGPLGKATGSAVWYSADGRSWERVVDPDLADGEIVSVTTGGPGYVAVGADLRETTARVWLSADGLAWERAPDAEDLAYHGLGITMSDVVAGRDGTLVAVGHFLFGSQFGQGTAWTSRDGRTWTRMPDEAAFGQGEPLAVIRDDAGYVAAGTEGAPDNFIPRIWLSPSR